MFFLIVSSSDVSVSLQNVSLLQGTLSQPSYARAFGSESKRCVINVCAVRRRARTSAGDKCCASCCVLSDCDEALFLPLTTV